MKSSTSIFLLVVASLWVAVLSIDAQVNVIQEHNNLSRDGLYIDAAFTPAAAAGLTRDLNFDGTISGNVYAQPLYIEGGPSGPMIVAVTESNNVYALNATTGTVIWQRTDLGPPVSFRSSLRKYQSGWDHRHTCGRSRLPITFLRRIDRWPYQEAFYLFVERGHRRHEFGLAGGCERHRYLQQHDLYFTGAGRTGWTGSCERDRVR